MATKPGGLTAVGMWWLSGRGVAGVLVQVVLFNRVQRPASETLEWSR